MTDIGDRAAAREAEMLHDAIDEQQRHDASRGKTFLDSARNCRACDEPIPEDRRRAVPGVQMCVDCQADRERRDGQGRKR